MVNDKILAINGQSVLVMTNKQILIKPNAEIVVIPSDLERRSKLCLRANGISAKKKNNNIITVLESNHSRIPIGSVILFINGIYSDFLDTLKVSEALLFPNCIIIFETDIINQCLEANSIYASRKGKSKELIVTHSTKSGIPIGTVVIKIDSLVVDQLSNEDIVTLLQKPDTIMEFAMPSEDAINYDAKQYAKQYDSFTQFDICGVCAVEYGPIHLRLIEDYDDIINSSNINVYYSNLLESLTNTDSTRFDKQYAVALQAEITTRGVLATAKYLCTFCLNQMKRTNKRRQSTMNDDDPTTASQANSIYAIPKESILNGHFAGAIAPAK